MAQGKRRFRPGLILERLANTSDRTIAMLLLVMNLEKLLRPPVLLPAIVLGILMTDMRSANSPKAFKYINLVTAIF